MANDYRKKGCPNEECSMHIKKIKQKASINYCPECSAKLIFVCSKCFDEIQDLGPKHRVCKMCVQAGEDKKQAIKEGALKVGGTVVAVVGTFGLAVYSELKKEGTKELVKAAPKVAKKVVKKIVPFVIKKNV